MSALQHHSRWVRESLMNPVAPQHICGCERETHDASKESLLEKLTWTCKCAWSRRFQCVFRLTSCMQPAAEQYQKKSITLKFKVYFFQIHKCNCVIKWIYFICPTRNSSFPCCNDSPWKGNVVIDFTHESFLFSFFGLTINCLNFSFIVLKLEILNQRHFLATMQDKQLTVYLYFWSFVIEKAVIQW